MNNGLINEKKYNNQKIEYRGSVISVDNKNYYVYGEEGNCFLVFEINDMNHNNELENVEIKLGKGTFYTNFKDEKINKHVNVDFMYVSTEKEIDYIKMIRKQYKGEQKKRIKIFNIGSIVEHVKSGKRYIIVKRCEKTYECIPMNSLKNASYNSIYLHGQLLKRSENKNLDGIKWLEDNEDFDLHDINDKRIIGKIIETQKEYLKHNKPEMDCAKDSNCHIGTIVKPNEECDDEYVVKNIIGNVLCCVNKADQNNIEPNNYYFNKDNVVIVESKKLKKIVIRKRK